MIPAMLRVMTLSLLRDRGALAMAFLLPPVIFVIFAAIFSGVGGDAMELRVVLGIERNSPAAERLTQAMRDEPSLRFLPETLESADAVAQAVNRGAADVGLVVTGDLADTTTPPITVLVDPGKVMAGAILSGQVQRVLAKHLPDLSLARTLPAVESLVGGWTPEQSARLTAAMEQMAAANADQPPALVQTSFVGPQGGSGGTVTYYAGAVAILFLLFSAMQSAATLIEERHSGILDRIAIGPAGTDVVVIGKWIFLTVQGMVQVALIFLVAALVYGVDVLSHSWLWFLTSLAAAATASGLGLAVASICTSRQQAQTISTFVVLVCSAIGGSMVPRFMMPPWLQDAGWYTPNAWAIEAYHGVLWRGEGLLDLLPELGWLWACALAATALALIVSRKRLRM
ncbi:ABC transporter permease [Devosia submarina]|uniref:ABC transporter permease n=1 Tax=Devosia submarina TaxID=1173082 RepID=UPI000D3A1BFE|nr:ABC transporter permease [Devosia submarina]